METLQTYSVTFTSYRPLYNAYREVYDYYLQPEEIVVEASSKHAAIHDAQTWFTENTGIGLDSIGPFLATEVTSAYAEDFENRD